MKKIIESQQVVTLTYELRESNAQGTLLERMDANYPLIFLFDSGKMLKSFEAKQARERALLRNWQRKCGR